MKRFIGLVLLFSPLCADEPNDQLLVIFGSSSYVLYKVLDFANDHGFRYVNILSYEFHAFDHAVSGQWNKAQKGGRHFELKDDIATVSFCCFTEPQEDLYTIDVTKYRPILDEIASSSE